MEFLFITLLALGAGFVQRTTGFGFGIFIMTALPYLMPSYGEATTLSGMLSLMTLLGISYKLRGRIAWKRLWPILITFLVVSAAAIFLLTGMRERSLRIILGVVLIATSLYFMLLGGRIRIRPSLPAQVVTGTLSGLMGGFFGMQGPPAVLYFISSEPDKEHCLAITSAYFCIGNAVMTLVRAANGYLTGAVGTGFLYGLAGALLGTWLGAKVFDRIPAHLFRYVVYAYIGLSGIITLVSL